MDTLYYSLWVCMCVIKGLKQRRQKNKDPRDPRKPKQWLQNNKKIIMITFLFQHGILYSAKHLSTMKVATRHFTHSRSPKSTLRKLLILQTPSKHQLLQSLQGKWALVGDGLQFAREKQEIAPKIYTLNLNITNSVTEKLRREKQKENYIFTFSYMKSTGNMFWFCTSNKKNDYQVSCLNKH